MSGLVLKAALFDVLEGVQDIPELTWQYADEVAVIAYGETVGGGSLLQLSSSLIRISQVLLDDGVEVAYELQLAGSGIGPVSTINALLNAIDDGFARGNLNSLSFLREGTTVLSLTADAAGYHLASGDIELSLEGRLPLSFEQLFDLADLLEDVARIGDLTRAERAALFDDLSAYAVTGLSLKEDGSELFAVRVAADEASLTLNGLTVTASGTFPGDLGEEISFLWDAVSGRPLGAAGLAITGLTFTDAAGNVVASGAGLSLDEALGLRLEGRAYDDLQTGANGSDALDGLARERTILAGLGGNDELTGGIKGDHLLGGSGNDTLVGGRGADRIDGGAGRDVLAGSAGADVFQFDLGDGYDTISGFAQRMDVIEILDATRKSDLTFTVVGDDVQIDFRSVHILVEDITLAQLNQVANFQF